MDKNKAEIISFINLKGGVGKTSTAINIADNFSRKGFNVLVVDMDPQFNATQALLNHQFRHHKDNIKKELLEDIRNELKEKLEGSDVESVSTGSEDETEDVSQDESYKKEISSQLIYNELKAKGTTVRSLFVNENIVMPIDTPSLIYSINVTGHNIPATVLHNKPGVNLG
ncbi:ParA family protein [Sporosarcina jeotgali]|uniref:ParA family protein n=1 Tax=Sporosarcina jeotgali TaxID=3020056 RepID=A0ABZ0KYM2_9BACL|nr:ParA family protein [Sporosarcina sp. B2O-1]WOV85007.1 ParA family protein [Sporosarcina sp. B2O-1]